MKLTITSRLAGLLAVLLLSACGGGDDAEVAEVAGPPVTGGMAVVAVKADFGGFNPITNSALATDDVLKYMLFTPLIQFDEQLNPQPYLAESWELSDSSVVFRLRQDVRWHDGQPVTAEDVKFTFDRAKEPETAGGLVSTYLGLVESATVIDPYTIRFDFDAPHAQPLEGFWWAPAPKHLLEDVPPAQLGQAPFNQRPVGSGPYRFVSWQQGQALTLEANPDFPEALDGRPNLDRVTFRIIPEATTRRTELTGGTVDVDYSLSPDAAQQIQQQQGRMRVESYPSREMTYLGWNNEREPFRDPRVRTALAMAVDREAIIEGLLFGFAEPSGSVIPPMSPLAPELPPLPHDPEAARRLLAEAGWRDTDGDGILEKDGQPLQFTLVTNAANQLFQDIAQVVQSQLRAVGAQVEVRTLEFQAMLQQHRARDYDAIITNWTWDYFRPDPTPLFSCEQAEKAQSANRAGYCNPQADQLMQAGLRETDPARAQQIWAQFARLIQQDQPITPLYWTEEIAGVGPRLQNVEMDARSKLVNVDEWWIPASAQRR